MGLLYYMQTMQFVENFFFFDEWQLSFARQAPFGKHDLRIGKKNLPKGFAIFIKMSKPIRNETTKIYA